MRLVTSENRPGRETLVPCRVVGAIVSAVFALTFWVGSAGAENRIFLRCNSQAETVTEGDMTAASIGEELADLSSDPNIPASYSLVLSYHEGGQSTPSHSGTGTFVHYGLTVVRPVASSSPLFWKGMVNGEVWPKCELSFTREDKSGTSVEYLMIELDSVLITQIEPRAVAQLEAPGTGRSHLEAITFLFGKIRWTTFEEGGESFQYTVEMGEGSK